LLTILLIIPVSFADISLSDKKEIQGQVELIVEAVNSNDIDSIIGIISDNARPELSSEIYDIIGDIIQFQQTITSYEELGDNQIKVKGRYSAVGLGWNIQGLSNYYIFEKHDGSWLLVDTNFHQKTGADFIHGIFGKISLIMIPIFLILGSFWLWMLLDCRKRQFDDKTMWILLIIFFTFIGAMLYFFTVRKKLIKQGKLQSGG